MANQTRQLAELLTTDGATVTTVQVNAPYWPVWVGHVPLLRSLFRLVPYVVELWRAAGRNDVFHIMANSGWSWHLFAAPAIWVAHRRRVAVVVNYRGGEAAAFLQRSGRVVRFSMRRASALLVPSGFLRDAFSMHNMQAVIVPNIIDLDRFRPRDPVRQGAPHLLVARNLELLYDNATAVLAFRSVRDRFPLARLTIAGSGPEERRLRQFVLEQGLADAVHFTGRLDRNAMAALYRTADIVLNPSLADNMPNSLLEAWASGVPVVSTNVGGIPYLAQDGVTATLVPPANPIAMAQACIFLLSNEVAWHQRAQAGLNEAKRYTWSCVQPLLIETYRQALQHTRHR
jgi:glycosyltransferase involved in cell wall biosynthesis